MRESDLLVVWRLDQLGRSLIHLIDTMSLLEERGMGLRTLLIGESKKTTVYIDTIYEILRDIPDMFAFPNFG